VKCVDGRLNRLDGEVERPTDVAGVFLDDEAIFRLAGAILLEQDDEWAVQRRRCMTLETIAAASDALPVGSPPMSIRPIRPCRKWPRSKASATPRDGTRSSSACRAKAVENCREGDYEASTLVNALSCGHGSPGPTLAAVVFLGRESPAERQLSSINPDIPSQRSANAGNKTQGFEAEISN
jgi:hypothetical protein